MPPHSFFSQCNFQPEFPGIDMNDFPNKINTFKQVKKLIKVLKENNENTEIFVSGVIHRYDDEEYNDKIDALNEKLEKYCKNNNIYFVNNANINRKGISKDNIHLNYSGNGVLARNFLDLFNSLD